MARNRIHVEAPPERVFAFLADAERYPDWVVGASTIRDYDEDFPAAGSRFHHEVGMRPATLSDHTEVVAVEPPRSIELKAKARPFGTASILIELSAAAGGTNVFMEETPGDRLTELVAGNQVADAALRLRNAEALSRLKRAIEDRPTGPAHGTRELAGQRVLITGGSSGIGLASAELLAEAGARLALVARGEGGLAKARRGLEEKGAEVHTFSADVTDRAAVEEAVAAAAEALGGIDVLVTAAAAASFGPFTETSAADFDATVASVLGGSANTIRAALQRLEESAGAIVAIGSTLAHMPSPGFAAYTAAKHGLAGFLDTLRIELREAGSPVTVSLLNPGPVDTPFWNHLESQTGLLPPVPPDNYSAATIAAALVAVVRRPREETTVGGSAGLQVALFRRLRGPSSFALAILSRLAQAGEDRPADATGGLSESRAEGEKEGGFGGRDSVAVRGLEAWDGIRRRVTGAAG